jgi:hypothetical protein
MKSEFQALLDAVVDQIKGIATVRNAPNRDEDFYETLVIPVTGWQAGDIETRFKIALTQIGVAVIVRKGTFQIKDDFAIYPFEVEIVEQTHLNRGELGAQVTAEMLSELIIEQLRVWRPDQVFSPATEINIATKEGDKRLSISLQFNFKAYAPKPRS